VEDLARQRLSLSQKDAAEHERPSPWSGRRMFGRGTGRSYSPANSASRLHGEGYRKLWARLRFAGIRASPRRVRRVMREMLAPHRVGRTEAKLHDGTIVTDKVNEMWGTDMTQTFTIREGRANVFVAVEHANSEVVGIHASRSANRFEALEPVRQGVHRCFGAIAPGVARGLKLRHDHGSNYMSGDFQDEIECLGIEASPSFVREPEGNGVAERFDALLEAEADRRIAMSAAGHTSASCKPKPARSGAKCRVDITRVLVRK
jgi:transposase InsO family protein